jgi:hypothetical protein
VWIIIATGAFFPWILPVQGVSNGDLVVKPYSPIKPWEVTNSIIDSDKMMRSCASHCTNWLDGASVRQTDFQGIGQREIVSWLGE